MAATVKLRVDEEGEVGLGGILKEAARILRNNAKHFLCLYSALLLPPAVLLGTFDPTLANVRRITHHPPPQNTDIPSANNQLPAGLVLLGVFAFAWFDALVALPPLTVISVCRGYLDKSVSVEGSMRAVRRSARGVALTMACIYAAMMGVGVGVFVVVVAVVVVLVALNVGKAGVVGATVLLGVVAMAGCVYLGIVWMLVRPVMILEEGTSGLGALSRSSFLVRGKRGLAFCLLLAFLLLDGFLSLFTASPGSSLAWKMGVGVANGAVRSFASLLFTTAVVVLYMTRLASHREPLEAVSAARPEYAGASSQPKYTTLSHIDIGP